MKNNLENLRGCVRIILKYMLKKYCVWVGTELICQWRILVNKVLNHRVPRMAVNFFTSWAISTSTKRDLLHLNCVHEVTELTKILLSSAFQSRILPERVSITRRHNTAPGIGLQHKLRLMLVVCLHNNETDYPSDTYIVYNKHLQLQFPLRR